MSNPIQNHLRRLGQYRIGSQVSLDKEAARLSESLAHELSQLAGGTFKVDYAVGQQYGGFTRFNITREGVQGPNSLTLDIRAGAESAYIKPGTSTAMPVLNVKMGGTGGNASQLNVGMKLRRRNQQWEERSPGQSLADLVAGAFESAATKFAQHPDPTGVDVRRELFALGTEGTERHADVRHRFGIPLNIMQTTAMASQGGQLANARRVGVSFDPEEDFWQQQADLEESLALTTPTNRTDRTIFQKLFKRGVFIVPDSEERALGLEWMGSSREVEGERQAMLHGGAGNVDYLNFSRRGNEIVNPTIGDLPPWTDAVVGAMKHIKNKTTLNRSREYVQPLGVVREGGRERFAPLGPQPISFYEKQYGQRYWEKATGPVIIHSGIIESGESAPRTLQVINSMLTPMPISGGGIVDESAFEGLEGYGIQTSKSMDLDFEYINDVVNAKFHVVDSRNRVSQAGQSLGLGYVQYNSERLPSSDIANDPVALRKWKRERTRALAIDSGPRAQQLLGMTVRLPEFYDEVTGRFVAQAVKRGDRYYAIGTNTQLRRTAENPLIAAKARELAGRGVGMDYTYETIGGSFEASVLGQVGAAWKSAGLKPGMILRQGAEQMFFQPEGRGFNKRLVQFATGEIKDPSELIKGTFRTQTYTNRINMLKMLGVMDIDGKKVNVGGKLAQWASGRFGASQIIDVDEMVSKYREITGSQTATEENIWLGLFSRIETMSEKESQQWGRRFGVAVPKDGWLDAGYISKSQYEYLKKEQDLVMKSSPGAQPLLKFLNSDNNKYMRFQVRVQGRTAKGGVRSLLMPLGLEAAVEWGGKQESLNFESSASLAASMPESAAALGARPEDLPARTGSRAAWLNVLKAWSLTDSYKQGYETEYRGRFVIDQIAADRIYGVLNRNQERTQSVSTLEEVNKILVEEYKNANPDFVGNELPEDTILEFERSKTFLPTPNATRETDILEPTRTGFRSKGHMVEQYVDALRDLSMFEADTTTQVGAKGIQSYQRYMGAIGSRLGKLMTKGKHITDQLLAKEIQGAIQGHYFHMATLETNEMYLPESEADRLGMAVGSEVIEEDGRLIRRAKEFGAKLKQVGAGMVLVQRDPVIAEKEGTIPLVAITDKELRRRGLKKPKAPWAYGAFGVSAMSTLGMVGDFDFDPMRVIAAANQMQTWEEAKGRGFNKVETYEQALQTLMRGEAEGYNVIRGGLVEGMDPSYTPFKMAHKTGWANLEVARRASKLYNTGYGAGGIMPLRGLSYTAFDKFKTMLALQHPASSDTTREALAAFTAQYQKSLEVSISAAQESSFQSIVNRARLGKRSDDDKLTLSTVINPVSAQHYAEEGKNPNNKGWGNIMSWRDGVRTQEESALGMWNALGSQADITDAMFATMMASGTGTDAWEGNVAQILGRMTQVRKAMDAASRTGPISEEKWLQNRVRAIRGQVRGVGDFSNLMDEAQGRVAGTDTVTHLSMLSTALERNANKVATGRMEVGDWYQMDALTWKGESYSQAALYDQPEFQQERYLRSQLTASALDQKRSLVPPAHVWNQLAETTNPNSMLGKAIRAARERLGFLSSKMRPGTGVTDAEIKAMTKELPFMMRGSEISSIMSEVMGLSDATLDDPRAIRTHLSKSGFPFKSMLNIAMRNMAGVLGEKTSGDILKQDPTSEAAERGEFYELYLEKTHAATGLIKAPKGDLHSSRSAATFGFRYRDQSGKEVNTDVWGTPDFFRVTKDSSGNDVLEIGEAKRYTDFKKGLRMAKIQASTYREGLINMYKGLGASEGQDQRELLRSKLFEWFRLASEQRQDRGYEALDYRDLAERAFNAIANERVVTRSFVGWDKGTNNKGQNVFEPQFSAEGVLQESNFTPTANYILGISELMKGDPNYLNKMLRVGMHKVMGRKDSEMETLLPSKDTPQGSAVGLSESILRRIPKLLTALGATTGATWVDRGWETASDYNIQSELRARSIAILGKDYEYRMGPKFGRHDNSTRLVAPGENIRNQRGEVSVVLGDTDQPGDQFTIEEAKARGMVAPKEVVDIARMKLQRGNESQKAAQARAVEVLSGKYQANQGGNDIFESPTGTNFRALREGTGETPVPSTSTPATPPPASTNQQSLQAQIQAAQASTGNPGGGSPGGGNPGGGNPGGGGPPPTAGMGQSNFRGMPSPEDRAVDIVSAVQNRLNFAREFKEVAEIARARLIAYTSAAQTATIQELLPMVGSGRNKYEQQRNVIGSDVVAQLYNLKQLQKADRAVSYSAYLSSMPDHEKARFTAEAAELGITFDDLVGKDFATSPSADIGENLSLLGLAKARMTPTQRRRINRGNVARAGANLDVQSERILRELGLGGLEGADIMQMSQEGRLQAVSNQISPQRLAEIKTLTGQVSRLEQSDYPIGSSTQTLVELQKELTKTKTSEKGVKMQQLSDTELVTQSHGFEDISSKLIASMDKLEKATTSHEKVTKDDIDASKKMHEDVTSQLKILEKQGVLGQTRLAISELTGGRDVSALSPAEKAQYRNLRAMEASQLAGLEKEMMDITKARQFEDENRKPMARFGNTLRSAFGGWGMMYMQRAIGVGLEALTGGGQEAAAFAMAERQAAYASGQGVPGLSQTGIAGHDLQRGLIRQGEGGLAAYTRLKARMTGTPAGELINAAQLGLATTLGATFTMGEMAQMGIMTSATAGTVGAMLGGAAAISYPYIQGYMKANDPTASGISAAAGMINQDRRAGQPMPFWNKVVNNFTALGQVARGTANWREYFSEQTEVQQTAREALWAADVIAGRNVPGISAQDTERYNRNKLITERTGAPMSAADEAFMKKYELDMQTLSNPHMAEAYRQQNQRDLKGMPKDLYFMGLKAEIQAVDGRFKGVSPEAALQAGYQLEAAGIRDYKRIATLAAKYDAGVNPELSRSVLSAGRFGINEVNYAAALENLPTSETGAMRLQIGTNFLGNFSNAYINQMGFKSVQDFMATAGGPANQWANSTQAPGMQMQSQLAERYKLYGFTPPSYQVNATDRDPRFRGAGVRTVEGIATPQELAAMSPQQQRETYAQSQTYMRGISAYENITELFGKAGVEMAQKFMETINTGGAIAGLASTPAINAMSQTFMMTGGNMQAAGAVGMGIMGAIQGGNMGTANQIQGALGGNPYALQHLMQSNPQLAAAMGQAGFGQLVDVNRQGQVTGLPLFTTNMTAGQAQQVWGGATNTPVAQAAVNGYTPQMSSTGQALYGIRAIQAWQADAGFNYQMQGIGLQQAGLNLQQQYMQQTWGVQDKMNALNYRQAMWGFSNQVAGLELNRSQFYENQSLNQRSFTMQKSFAKNDWEYQDQVRALQWQWKQEDYGEEVRFMTGRQRRLAERGMRRDTTMHNLEEDHIKDQRKQQQELWKFEEERFRLTKKHFEENYHFQMQAIEKQKQFYMEQRQLQLQMEQIQRRYQQEQMKLQQQQINLQRQYAEEMHRAQTQMMELSNYTQDVTAGFEQAWNYLNLAKDAVAALGQDLLNAATNARNVLNNTSAINPPTAAQQNQAAGGEFKAGQSMWVGEWGPELVQFNTAGKVIPQPINPWQKTVVDKQMSSGGQTPGGTITLNIYVGNERIAQMVIDAVSQEISV